MLRLILLDAASVWGSAANTNIQKFQTRQNKLFRTCFKFLWYIRNQIIHESLKIEPIRKNIKNFAKNFYCNIYSISNPEIFSLQENDSHQY